VTISTPNGQRNTRPQPTAAAAHAVRVAGLLLASGMLAGCGGVAYVAQLAAGQFQISGRVEPIEDVLASGRLSQEDADKLRLIVRAREYAAHVIGLNAGNAYTTFYDTNGDPLAWNLSAARQDALVARTWRFPLVGEFPYLTFFDEEYLHEVERALQQAGYDTLTYELDAYSTLGIFEDPVRSPMLRRSPLSLVETIIHELLHNTIWRPNAATFNESLATFVGRQGTIEFLRDTFGEESGWPQFASRYYADVDRVNAFLAQLYEDLEAYYAQPLSRAQKIAGRESVYQAARDRFTTEVLPILNYGASFAGYTSLPTNNAWVLANQRYNLDLDVFAQVHEATGGNWAATLAVFRAAANTPQDPFEYLRTWLTEQTTQP
jgi:predicted aminopeptidase